MWTVVAPLVVSVCGCALCSIASTRPCVVIISVLCSSAVRCGGLHGLPMRLVSQGACPCYVRLQFGPLSHLMIGSCMDCRHHSRCLNCVRRSGSAGLPWPKLLISLSYRLALLQLLCYKTYFVGTTMLHIRFCWHYDATNHIWLQQGHVTTPMLLELLCHKSYFVGATMLQIIFCWNYYGANHMLLGLLCHKSYTCWSYCWSYYRTLIACAAYIAHGHLTMSLGSDYCGIIVLTIRVETGMGAYLGTSKYLGIY